MNRQLLTIASVLVLSWTVVGLAQAPAGRGGGPQAPQFSSPEVTADRRISFRILAPQAREIRLNASDIPGLGQNTRFTKADNGVWELTTGVLEPGAYRYTFVVNGEALESPASREAIAEDLKNLVA